MITRRRRRYAALREQWPKLFVNPPGFSFEILTERSEIRAAEAQEGNRLAARNRPRRWRRTGVLYEDQYLIVVRDAVRFPDGNLGTYVRTLPASGFAGAAVLPVLGEKIVLLHHSRHATRREHLEIPRGFGEPGVPAVDQALRELREEIEAEADTPVSLGVFHSNNGIATDCVELFIAQVHGVGKPEFSEGITGADTYTPGEIADLIRTGEITDSFTIAAFTRASLAGHLPGYPPIG